MAQRDTVIVGGGFAGITAARELTMRGRTAVLVEARDRLGGRTHTVSHDGHELELGGTWVHPIQPNVWAEITRYGLDVEVFPVPDATNAFMSGGKVSELTGEESAQALDALTQFCAPGSTLFADPYAEAWGPDSQQYGDRSARQHLDSLQLPPHLRDMVDAMCSAIVCGSLDEAAATDIMRVFALSYCNPELMFAALSVLKLTTGTRSLIEAMVSQATLTDIRLQSPVRRIAQTGDGVTVELDSGEIVSAHTALITLPMNALNSIEFEPALSDAKRAAGTERHVGAATKCYVHVKGDIGNVSIYAPETEAINWLVTYSHGTDGSVLIVFGKANRLPLDDIPNMQSALSRLLPGVTVESIFGWDWAADPFALGTWCIFRPGQLTRLLPDLRRSEGRLFFASGDSAVAWRGFIDGAIESGYRAAREIDGYLSTRSPTPKGTS